MSRFAWLALIPLAACVPPIDADVVRLTVDGSERTAYVHVPDNATRDTPLLLAFHGASLTGAWRGAFFADDTDLIDQANSEGFAVAFPNGINGKWSDSQDEGPDDQAFVEALLDELSGTVDTSNVVAAGHSNGAFFSMRLGCERPDLLMGVVSVAGGLLASQDCSTTMPISVMVVAGTQDDIVPYEGGKVLFGLGPRAEPHEDVVDEMLLRMNCPTTPPQERTRDGEDDSRATIRTHTGCDADTEVVDVSIVGGNHVWPGRDDAGPFVNSKQAFQASEEIAAFAQRAWAP